MSFVGLHIHKTAGTSLLRYIDKQAPHRLYGAYALRNYRRLELPLWASGRQTSRDIFWGHAIYESFFYESITPLHLFTFLRDPVDRIVSWYSMLKRRKKLKKAAVSLEAFAERHKNSICKMIVSRFPSLVEDGDANLADQALSVLDHMAFVGFQSQYDIHLRCMLDWMQVPICEETLSTKHNTAKTSADIDASDKDLISRLNRQDIRFYKIAHERYANHPLNVERQVNFGTLLKKTPTEIQAIKAEQTRRAQKKFISSLRFSLGGVGMESYVKSLHASFAQCKALLAEMDEDSSDIE